ncbi:MAG: hypothetical protein MK078_12780 [Crocinitomicaceae bacterium]|nr:hypothetical protein [Crocinitomicaceae bacterium]
MNSKREILFIINPISGIGKKNKLPEIIEKNIDSELFNIEISYTEYPGHGHEIAEEKSKEKDLIVAVGGDGSLNEIGSALVGKNCALGIIPCGSGNGFARHHNIPLKSRFAVNIINNWKIIKVDSGTINGNVFLGNCGAGFDAHIAKRFNEEGKRGFTNYARLVWKEFKNFEEFPVKFKIDSENVVEESTILINVSNGSQFGNNFYISPNSRTNDGKMELILLKKFPLSKSIAMGYKFFRKVIQNSIYYKTIHVHENVEIELPKGTPVQIDGDYKELPHSLKISILPQSLNLLIP